MKALIVASEGNSAAPTAEKLKDPVCGMTGDPAAWTKHAHAGRDYHFCSGGCLEKFKADPAKYAK